MLKRGLLISSAILVIFIGSYTIPIYSYICKKNEYTSTKECTSYHISTVVFWHIGEFLNYYGGAITAIATTVIGYFTYTLYKTSIEQSLLTRSAIDLTRQEFIATHRPVIVIRNLFIVRTGNNRDIRLIFNVYNKGANVAHIIELKFFMMIRLQHGVDTLLPQLIGTVPVLPCTIEAGYDAEGNAEISDSFGEWLDKDTPAEWEITLRITSIYTDSTDRRRQTSVHRMYDVETLRFSRIEDSEFEYQD